MCGIAGFLDGALASGAADLQETAERMAQTLVHRGPDDGGTWVDTPAGVALGHRRLAIIDLSALGHQPMVSANGRFVISYNGEVYNFRELRQELASQGAVFRGGSDTEVMLEACAAWGPERAIPRLIGMFAFALWDRAERRLLLVRDRLGIKPLYWAKVGSLFLFGSELKALRAHPGWRPEIDRNALSAYLRHAYVPSPHSIYRGVFKLEPGTLLSYRPGEEPRVERYWDLRAIAREQRGEMQGLSAREAADELEALLKDAVGRRMIADVPLGAFLSGGYDSSMVVALMQSLATKPVRTFTIGFRESGYDEAPQARAVAAHLATEHTELYAEPQHALEVVPKLADWFDEPFADSSQVPTYLVSELTRGHVTVSLSGDGGDELFAGYNRYFLAHRWWRRLNTLPLPVRRLAARGLKGVSAPGWDRLLWLAPALRLPQAGDKVHKFAELLALEDPGAVYRRLVTTWDDPDELVRGASEPRGLLWDSALAGEFPSFIDRMRLLDTLTYLPDDILTKVDRASMAVALEARVPLLDHRVVEFVWRLPGKLVSDAPEPKWLLRSVLRRYVPAELTDRPKMGFGVPIGAWLKGPLRDWAEALIAPAHLKADGLFDPAPIERAWREHLAGTRDWKYPLWTILMFQSWKARWM
ncbi:MAG TPA: asparagine synthase (glutamine-hydrolyzing) [Alphaproteobacteria bacterium]|nr:asparagine synthase (glutamine-hydrolyzing) [Alphaproteobacteria bacterium]